VGTIVISTNATLDGVVEDPDGTEGSAAGGWFAPVGGTDREAWAEVETAEALRADALLLGRRSYEWLATRWAPRRGVWADRLNGLPKYVVSSTLPDEAATWGPTTVLRGDPGEQVAQLKLDRKGDIVVYASYQLGHALMELDLVDEVRLVVAPVVAGAGKRLFGVTSERKALHLAGATTIGDGLAMLTYQVLRDA
jgi:dihydrofolate reductase